MFVHTVIMVIEPHMKQGRQHKLISTIFLATSVTKKLDHNKRGFPGFPEALPDHGAEAFPGTKETVPEKAWFQTVRETAHEGRKAVCEIQASAGRHPP